MTKVDALLAKLEGIRGMGFSALLGGSLGGVIYILVKLKFMPEAELDGLHFIYTGVMLGGGIDGIFRIFKKAVSPIGRYISFVLKMIELRQAEKSKLFDQALIDKLRNTLLQERYLGHVLPNEKVIWEKGTEPKAVLIDPPHEHLGPEQSI